MRQAGAAVLLLGLAGTCTKVNEQPVARQEMQAAPAEAKPLAKPAPPTTYTFSTSGETPAPVARRPLPPDPAAPVTSLNGDPKGLQREDLSRAMNGVLPSLANCFQEPGGPSGVGLSFEADPSGKARNIKVTGGSAAAQGCVSTTLAAVRLPSFEGKPVPVDFPLSVQRIAAAPAAAPPAPSPPPAAAGQPGLFVKP
jgi:hypothetical protein